MGRYDLIFSLNFILVVLYSSIWIPWLNFKWIYFKGDALLSRHTGIDIDQLSLTTHIANTHSGEVTDSFLFFFFLHIHVLIISLIYHIFLLSKACWLTSIWNLCKVWRGQWQKNDIVAKILSLRECTVRNSRDFQEEFPRLRFV